MAVMRGIAGKILLLVFCLAGLELALRLYVHFPSLPGSPAVASATRWERLPEVTRWKLQFLDLYEERGRKAIPISQNEYRPHPVLGWVPNPGHSFTNSEGQRYTTNRQGFRSPRDYALDGRFTVLVVGDSFTYGSGADDSEVWPTILQEMRPDLNVINLGVGAYGTDQMLLMLEDRLPEYRPDLVIVAFISDDLHRTLLPFRDYWKPYFRIEDSSLVLRGTPVPELSEGVRRIHRQVRLYKFLRLLGRSRVFGIVLNFLNEVLPDTSILPPGDKYRLNELIFERMLSSAHSAGSEALLLYLPVDRELVDPDLESPGEDFLARFTAGRDVRVLNPRSRFLESKREYSREHYRRPAAAVVAETVSAALESNSGPEPPGP